jgi:hypothetical protein
MVSDMLGPSSRPSRPRRGQAALLVLTLALPITRAASAEPTAQDRETARTLMVRGDKALEEGRPGDALQAFEAARALVDVPTTAVGVAKARAELGQLIEARDLALSVARSEPEAGEPDAFKAARLEAAQLAKALAPRIATLEIAVSGPANPRSIEVLIDGETLPAQPLPAVRRVNPGEHRVVVRAAGHSPVEQAITLGEGATERMALTLQPSLSPSDGTPFGSGPIAGDRSDDGGLSPLVFIGFGVGAVGIAAGAITGVLSLARTSDAETHCVDGRCTPEAQDDIDAAQTLATISNVSFAIGAAGVVAGFIGVALSGPSDDEGGAPTARLSVGPATLHLEGTF